MSAGGHHSVGHVPAHPRRQAALRPSVELPLTDPPKPEPKAKAETPAPSPRPAGSGRHAAVAKRGRSSGRHKAPKLNFAAAAERAFGSSSSSTALPEPRPASAFGSGYVDRPKRFPWVLVLVAVGLLAGILLLAL